MRIGATFLLAVGLSLYCSVARACCSLYPAHFSDTIVYAGEAMRKDTLVHVLGYQNTALNRSPARGGNAMLLPIPAKSGTMTSANILDTSKCKDILSDMKTAVENMHQARGIELGCGALMKGAEPVVQVFEHDIYTIVLAQDASAIPAALNQVPEAKRPAMNKAIFSAYQKWYPGYTFALCCFNNKEAAIASPMLWWYEPSRPEELFCPALDAHNGKAPNLEEMVEVDHVLAAGSHKLQHPIGKKHAGDLTLDEVRQLAGGDIAKVGYSNQSISPEVRNLLPECVVGEVASGMRKNGDFIFRTDDVRRGVLRVIRKPPEGAPN